MHERSRSIAAEAVLKAGAIQKEEYGTDFAVAKKGEIDLVTEVDKACEAAIVELLRARTPEADIVTEESDIPRTGASRVWFVDPLDGTTNFAHGYPCFCASVALAEEGIVVAGAVYDPLGVQLFTAGRGGGSTLNGRALRVSKVREISDALLVTGFPYDVHSRLADRLRLFTRLVGRAQGIRRDGAAALDLSYLAAGRVDAFWEENLKPWDVLAGGLILEEAGGLISRFDGSPLGLGGSETLATNRILHAAMMEEIRADRAEAARVAAFETSGLM